MSHFGEIDGCIVTRQGIVHTPWHIKGRTCNIVNNSFDSDEYFFVTHSVILVQLSISKIHIAYFFGWRRVEFFGEISKEEAQQLIYCYCIYYEDVDYSLDYFNYLDSSLECRLDYFHWLLFIIDLNLSAILKISGTKITFELESGGNWKFLHEFRWIGFKTEKELFERFSKVL